MLSLTAWGALLMSMACAWTASPCMPRANPTAAERTEPANRRRSMVDNLLWKSLGSRLTKSKVRPTLAKGYVRREEYFVRSRRAEVYLRRVGGHRSDHVRLVCF